MLWEAKEETPALSWWGHSKGSFPVNQVAPELLSFTWKDEEAKRVGLGMSFVAKGAECAKAWRRAPICAVCKLGWGAG